MTTSRGKSLPSEPTNTLLQRAEQTEPVEEDHRVAKFGKSRFKKTKHK